MDKSHTTTDSDQLSTNANANSQIKAGVPKRSDFEKEYFQRERRDKENRRKREVIEILGGPKPFDDFTFEKFRPHNAFNAFEAAMRFQPDKDNLFLYGANSVGKTHLATAVARKYLDLGFDVRFFYLPTLIRDFRIRSGNGDFASEKKWIKRLVDAQVLGLDELGQGTITGYVIDIICEILDRRYRDNRNGLIMTSNYPLKDPTFKYGNIQSLYGGKVNARIERICRPDQIILVPGKGSK